jgi:hypothetical protein
MKSPMLFMALATLVAMPANAQIPKIHTEIHANTTTGNRVVTHMAAGGGWSTLIELINLGSTVATYDLQFHTDAGGTSFSFKNVGTQADLGNQSALTGTIPVGGFVSLMAQDVGAATITGWASIDESSTGDIGALVIFGYKTGQKAVVPIETSTDERFILPFDNSGGNVMGVALANPHSHSVAVNIVFRDLNGLTLHSESIQMAPLQHTSFLLANRFPSLAGHAGTALFSTGTNDDAVAALGILANSVGAYTTVFSLAAQ